MTSNDGYMEPVDRQNDRAVYETIEDTTTTRRSNVNYATLRQSKGVPLHKRPVPCWSLILTLLICTFVCIGVACALVFTSRFNISNETQKSGKQLFLPSNFFQV